MTNLKAQTLEIMPAKAIRLVVMLYEGAIASLEAGIADFEKKNFDEGAKSVDLSLDIISQLYLALDSEKGGEIADNLARIYGYMLKELQKAKDKNDPQILSDMAGLLKHLYESWHELDAQMAADEKGGDRRDDAPARHQVAG